MLDERDAVERALATLIVDEFRQSRAPPFALPQPTSADDPQGGYDARRRIGGRAHGRRWPVRSGSARGRSSGTSSAETGMTPGPLAPAGTAARRALSGWPAAQSVKAVAADAGYASPSAFVAAFRKQFSVTPSRYFAQG